MPYDAALAGAIFVGSIVLLLHGKVAGPLSGLLRLNPTSVALTACSTLPLVAWRRFPLAVLAISAAASATLVAIGYLIELPLGLTLTLFFLAANWERELSWTLRTKAIVVILLLGYLVALAAGQPSLPGIVAFHTTLVWVVAWFAGERMRLRSERIARLGERARAAERESERDRQFAVATERARIARDLHDSAGHAMSIIALRAGAARLRYYQEPDRALRALEAIEELARHTVDEIDRMVGSLREKTSANGVVETPAGLASLDTVIAQRRAAGLEVNISTFGTRRSLSGVTDQAAFRIIQEALTNAARYGDGSARLEVRFTDTAVEIRISNPARSHGRTQAHGHGLIGMRERAILVGGEFHAERLDDVFHVHARIPYRDDRS